MNNLKIIQLPSKVVNNTRWNGATAYCIDESDSVFLRNLQGGSLIVDRAVLDMLLAGDLQQLSSKLYARGFVEGLQRFDIWKHSPCPRFFMIDFTTRCNLNCYYCLRNFPDEGENITWEQLVDIVDYISKYCHEYSINEIWIQPWGGEPLLALDLIYKMLDRFSENGIKVNVSIQSNGLLLNDATVQELKSRNISLGISIDGCKEIHDFHRKTWHDGGSFDRVAKAIETVRKYYGQNFGTITVNSKFSLEYIEKSLDCFAKELQIKSIKMNLMHPNSDSFDQSSTVSEVDIPQFIERVFNKLISLNREGYSIFDSNIRDKLENLLLGGCSELCHSDGCTGGFSSVTFSRDGKIYPCELVGYDEIKLGSIQEGKLLPSLIESSVECNPYFMQKTCFDCNSCPWYVHCRGGCTASIMSYGKQFGNIDSRECAINRYLYPRLIELILCSPKDVEYLTNGKVKISQ